MSHCAACGRRGAAYLWRGRPCCGVCMAGGGVFLRFALGPSRRRDVCARHDSDAGFDRRVRAMEDAPAALEDFPP